MLKENEDALEGTVKLLSQPGEEDAQVTGMTAAEARRFPIPRARWHLPWRGLGCMKLSRNKLAQEQMSQEQIGQEQPS